MPGEVLVVDDEPALCELLTQVLTEEGYPSRGFTSASACLRTMEAGLRPAVILVDLRMAEMPGREFVSRVRAMGGKDPPQIYVVSGSMAEHDYPPDTAIQGVVRKPFDLRHILRIVAKAGAAAPARPRVS